ncbi:MAG: tetratricopeptide repeat protein, partial [Candidatus Muiribacteriaceae bacterium]
MNSKDLNENLQLAVKFYEMGESERALHLIDLILNKTDRFLYSFVYRNIRSEALRLKLNIFSHKMDHAGLRDLCLKERKLVVRDREMLLMYRKTFDQEKDFDDGLMRAYLKYYPYDSRLTCLYVKKRIEEGVRKEDIPVFKRYCLDNKKDFSTCYLTIGKITSWGLQDLKYITIVLNLFYNISDRDDRFYEMVRDFIRFISTKRRIWKRKIFYPVFQYYYINSDDKSVVKNLFRIIRKNRITDSFAEEIVTGMYKNGDHSEAVLSVLSLIKRVQNDQSEEALKVYSELYRINPKNIHNTKFLANVLRERDMISGENIDIFLKAYSLFEESEKDSRDYRDLVSFLADYLDKKQNYSIDFSFLIEDILRLCTDERSYLYAIRFYYRNTMFDKAFFLLKRINLHEIPEDRRADYYYLYIKIFLNLSYTRSFLDYNWKQVHRYLKYLKKNGKYKVAFEIAQYYVLRKNRDNLPVCFFSPERCMPWKEKCFFIQRLDELKKNLSPREMHVIRNYLKLAQTKPDAVVFKQLFLEENMFIPLNIDFPITFCINIQKLLISGRSENAYTLFADNPQLNDFPGFAFWTAIIFYNLHKYDDAILILNEVIDEQPSNAYAFFYRGMCFYRKNMFFIAYSDLKKVSRMKLEDRSFLRQIIRIFIREKYFQDAIRLIEKLEKSEDMQRETTLYRADIAFRRKKYEQALQYIEELDEEGTHAEDVLILKGKVFFHMKEYEKASEMCDLYIDRFGEDPEIIHLRSRINFVAGDYRLVIKDLDRIVQRVSAEDLYMYAASYFNLGETEQSEKYLRRYRENVFFDIRSNILLSRIYLKDNLGSKALNLLRFTFLISKNRDVLIELVRANREIGNNSKVIYYSEKFFRQEKSPDNEVYLNYLEAVMDEKLVHRIERMRAHYLKYYGSFDDRVKKRLMRALYMIGDFDSIIKYSEDQAFTGELSGMSRTKSIYIVRENGDHVNISCFRGDTMLFTLRTPELHNDHFLRNIDVIFYYRESGTARARTRYFSDHIYNLNDILFLFRMRDDRDRFFNYIQKEL